MRRRIRAAYEPGSQGVEARRLAGRPQPHTTGIAYDGPQPGSPGGGVAHVADAEQRGECGVLHRVLRVGPMAEETQRHRAHGRLMAGQEQAEGRRVPGLGPAGEFRIRGRVECHHARTPALVTIRQKSFHATPL
ncbi:hypothetical protein GCM10022284_11460 [Streptomyces hundungensis]